MLYMDHHISGILSKYSPDSHLDEFSNTMRALGSRIRCSIASQCQKERYDKEIIKYQGGGGSSPHRVLIARFDLCINQTHSLISA